MASATITAAWHDSSYAFAAASVTGDDPSAAIEYVAKTPLYDNSGNMLPLATIKTNLIAALQAVRNQQLTSKPSLAINGTFTL